MQQQSASTVSIPRRVPWHIRALASVIRAAWRAGLPCDPWEQQVCRRAAGGAWERRRLHPCAATATSGAVVGTVEHWYPVRVEILRRYDVVAGEAWA